MAAQFTIKTVLLLSLLGHVLSDVCSDTPHPEDPALTMSSCQLDQPTDIADIPDVAAIELKFAQMNTIDFDQLALAPPNLNHLVFDMTYVSFAQLKKAMNGITAPKLETLTVKRDLDRDGTSLYIDSQTFSNLPMVNTLNLKGIGLATLHNEALRGLSGLSVLDLSENYLIEIPEYALQDCRNLTILRLQRNFIEPPNLLEHSFTGPTGLHWLNLENNKITNVPANRFTHLASLSILYLTYNDVESVEPEAFKGLTSLHFLSLSNNKLSSVPSQALEDIPNLYSLDLSLNEINDLPDGGFESLSDLEVLYLQYTNLGDVSGESFRGLAKLRELHLKSNQIRSVNATTFQHLPQVKHIDLAENKLRAIPVDTFSATPNLEVLDLSGNQLRHLEEGMFAGLPLLNELHLGDNRWNCTCDLLWLFQWIHDNEDHLANEHQLYTIPCSSPERYQHYTFFDLRLSFVMGCQEELTLLDDITTEAQTVTGNEDGGLSSTQLAGIIAGIVIFLILIVVIVIVFLFVRRKRTHRFWKPSQQQQQPGARDPESVQREQRLQRHRTPSWCKDPEPVVPRSTSSYPAAAAPSASAPPPAYTPEQRDNKANDVFAFDNMALETSMMSRNGASPTKSNGSTASPTRFDNGQPALTSSPRDHTAPSGNVNLHINVDINKNMT